MKKFTVIYDYGFMKYVDVVKAFTKFGARLKSRGMHVNDVPLQSVTIYKGGLNEDEDASSQ